MKDEANKERLEQVCTEPWITRSRLWTPQTPHETRHWGCLNQSPEVEAVKCQVFISR